MIASAKRYMTAIAAAALITVAVSACGGGGGDGPVVNGPKPPANVDLSRVTPGFMAGAGTVTIVAGESEVHGDIAFGCATGGADCKVMVMVDMDGAISATSTGGMVTAGNAPGYPPEPPVVSMVVDLSNVTVGFLADAITMLEIKAGKSKNHGDITFSCAADGRDCEVMVMMDANGGITATSTGGMVTASDASDPNTLADQRLDAGIKAGHAMNLPALQPDGTPPASLGYVAMTDTAVAKVDVWTPSVHELETPATNADAAMTDTLVIYSNTDFEIAENFADKHMLNTNPDGNNNYQSLNIYYGNLSQVSDVSNFPSTPDLLSVTVAMNVGGTGYEGMFDGAAGEYWCASAGGCEFSTDTDGNLSSLRNGTLYFTPAAGAEVDVPNPDYMYFGYWQKVSEDGDGDPTFEIAGLYGGPEPSPIGYVRRLLEGSATYKGLATGLYVRRWTSANSTVLRRRTGQFTAYAVLSANFGGGDIAVNDQYSISGTISNFMAGDREIDPSWHLELGRADFHLGAPLGPYNDFMGVTQDVDAIGNPISGSAAKGAWNGRFFGNVEVDNDPVALGNQSTLPSGVAGDLEGHFNNGDVIGAFGAEQQE